MNVDARNGYKDRSRYDVPLSRETKRDPVVVVFYAIGFVVSGISLIIAGGFVTW